MKNYKPHWIKFVQRDLEGYKKIAKYDPFRDWDSLVHFDSRSEADLVHGMELLCGDMEFSLSKPHFHNCVKIAEKVRKEKTYLRPQSKGFYPINRGILSRAECYAKWFLTGVLDFELLTQAADDILSWCKNLEPGDWQEDNQEDYLSAVSMLLMIKELGRIRDILDDWIDCRERKQQSLIVKSMAINLVQGKPLGLFGVKFATCLEKIRRPKNVETINAFEMAVLRVMFFSDDNTDNLPIRAIELMSA